MLITLTFSKLSISVNFGGTARSPWGSTTPILAFLPETDTVNSLKVLSTGSDKLCFGLKLFTFPGTKLFVIFAGSPIWSNDNKFTFCGLYGNDSRIKSKTFK